MPDPNPRTPEEAARLEAARASLDTAGPLPEGVEISFGFMDEEETIRQIDEQDAATFLKADGFGWYKGGSLPLLPAIEISGIDWLEHAVRDGRATCAAFGIGHQIEGIDVPLFASLQMSVGDRYTPILIWIDEAPKDWLVQALQRFIVVWPEGPDGLRAWVATGPLNRHPEGLVVPPKMGRNSPCPCGSGLKYKKCHGR